VETYQWKKIEKGEVDIVFGKKGTGKSAIYSLIKAKEGEFFDRRILVSTAENPHGAAAFELFSEEDVTTARECSYIWKLYILSLVANTICEFELETPKFLDVKQILQSAGLIEKSISLKLLLKRVYDYVVSLGGIESIEPQIKFDPNSGLPTGFGGRIAFREPSEAERKEGKVAVDDLIDSCNSVLAAKKYQIWVLIDRLDVIFDGNPEKEKIALRSLFEVYKDFLKWDQIRPKIFIRDDIWKTISVGKFREANPGRSAPRDRESVPAV
jgi:hypothetical protein